MIMAACLAAVKLYAQYLHLLTVCFPHFLKKMIVFIPQLTKPNHYLNQF